MKSGRGITVTDKQTQREIEALHRVYSKHPKDIVTVNRLAQLTEADNWLELAGRLGNADAYLQLALRAKNDAAIAYWTEKSINCAQARDFQDPQATVPRVEWDPRDAVWCLPSGLQSMSEL